MMNEYENETCNNSTLNTSNNTTNNNNNNQQVNNNDIDNNNIAIVRSIASYLSLSEVESIGSLYSMVSPQSHYMPHHHQQQYQQHNQYQYQRTPRNNIHTTLNNHSIREEDEPIIPMQQQQQQNCIHSKTDDHSNSSTNTNTNNRMIIHSSSSPSSSSNNIIEDGPDAAAGFGSADSLLIPSSSEVITEKVGNSNNNNDNNNNNNNNIQMIENNFDQNSTIATPGLIALSPIPLDDDYNDNDENENNQDESSTLLNMYNTDKQQPQQPPTVTTPKSKTYHLLKIQKQLQNEIMSHPNSIRSYCVSSHEKALELNQKRHQQQCYQLEQEQRQQELDSLIGVLCPDCDHPMNILHYEFIQESENEGEEGKVDYDGIDDHGRKYKHVYTCMCQETYLSSSSTSTMSTSIISNQQYSNYSEYYYHNINYNKNNETPIHIRILQILTSPICSNIPLSILFDLSIQTIQTTNDTFLASIKLTSLSLKSILQIIARILHSIGHILSKSIFNPFVLLDFLLDIQHKALGIIGGSSDVIVTGIQSVATGTLGSISDNKTIMSNNFTNGAFGGNIVMERDGMVGGSVLSSSVRSGGLRSNMSDWWRGGVGVGGLRGNTNENGNLICEKMFRKLKKVDSAAKVIKYIERDDEVLTHHAKKRVQKMMHYRVPLRPFVATIEVQQQKLQERLDNEMKKSSNSNSNNNDDGNGGGGTGGKKNSRGRKFKNIDFSSTVGGPDSNNENMDLEVGGRELGDASSVVSSTFSGDDDEDDDTDSPFMCTPKSFPPTPSSRAHVMARGTKFAQDVVFLARDQLRVQEGLDSKNEQTRAMAKALLDGKRLAVFNAADVGGGIHLSCGQHCASKVGNDLYCSAKGMIPVLRNSFVYFEMSVSTPALLSMMLHHASLSIGLSTLEMPSNALVGTWKGSVGLCSTGQIIAGSQWCSPLEQRTYGSGSTVGCLVYLDDGSAFETWDGVMVTASIVFNVDGHVIVPAGVMGQGGHNANQTQNHSSMVPSENNEPNAVLPLFVPREEELYPTLTLHSTQTEVLCRFCASDILATSRSAIGAPDGVTVYAVDGSVLFDAKDGYNIDGDSSNLADLSQSSMHSMSDVETPRLENQDSFIYNSIE